MNTFLFFRNRASLSQEIVSESLGITQGAVSQWEKGLTYPSTKLLPKLAELYGCSIDALLSHDAEDEANTA